MAILGIKNRTENWRTASVLSPLVEKPGARISLASHLIGSREQLDEEIEFELFWRGMRDYRDQRRCQEVRDKWRYVDQALVDQVRECYRMRFPHLPQKIKCIRGLKDLKAPDCADQDSLYRNLLRTEVEIVLQTPRHMCIGKAEVAADLGTDSNRIFVHSLIRQYVMAKILVELTGNMKRVVPFVVGDCRDKLMRRAQVEFMVEMNYLSERNVLSWKQLSEVLETDQTIPCGQDLERRFNDLAKQWASETVHHSMMSSIVLHRSYQEIIGLGRDVLPLILKKLSIEPNHWFWALRAISGEDPVPACEVGKFDAMRSAWLDWGRERGLV